MKKADIIPGIVYAWTEYDGGEPRQVMFLAPLAELYTDRDMHSWKHDFRPARTSITRPTNRSYKWYECAGYLVAMGTDVTGATLAGALAAKDDSEREHYTARTYSFDLLYTLTHVVGPWEQVKAARDEAERIRAEWKVASEAANAEIADRFRQLASRLSAAGIHEFRIEDGTGSSWNTDPESGDAVRAKSYPPARFVLNADDTEALLRIIERS